MLKFKVDSSKLFSMLETVVKKEFENVMKVEGLISTSELIQEAQEQVRILRAEVLRYDSDRKSQPKPCKNYSKIANRIVEQLTSKHELWFVHREYAYKVMFIMYLICKIEPPIRCSWWEREFVNGLADYLECTNYFTGVKCATRWAVILDQIPGQGRLPLDVTPIIPPEKPRYPIIGSVNVYQNCIFDNQVNHGCIQLFNPANNPTFQEAQ